MKSLDSNGKKHSRLTFQQKILISYLFIFLMLTLLLYPVVTILINSIQERNLRNRTEELIQNISSSSNVRNMIERLKQREKFLFFRVSLLDPSQGYIYDSLRQIGAYEDERFLDLKEVQQALDTGSGYDVRYSSLFGQEMAYMAVRFSFQDRSFVLRTAFPYGQIAALSHDLSLSFLFLGIFILLLFCSFAWFILSYFTRPVQRIIEAIKPYQLGEEERIPEIHLARRNDEFGRLADTLNSLSKRIDAQIKTLTKEKNEKSAILESLVEGVVALDSHMNVIYMNKMAETFLSTHEDELVGMPFSLVRQPLCEEIIREALAKQEPISQVLKPERKQKRILDVTAVPLGGGAILVLQDKTKLHKVIEMGRDFIANASHELKTPITIIRGFAETLHDHPDLTPEMYLEVTEKIVSNCQRMDTLVKNLLTLAAIDEGLPRSRLEECDLVDLSEQAKQTILSVHPDAVIQIEKRGEEPFHLLADSDLFFQALLNLLDNAVKYSKAPAEVKILIERREKEFVMKISDKGIGIPHEDLDRIFERFYAVNKSHSRSLGGSGLGLSIVERIVEKHKGKIEVESFLGEGTTFIITLPIQEDI